MTTSRVIKDLAVIDLDAEQPTVAVDYSARPIIKAVWPRLRRWDPDRGVWVVGRGAIHSLIRELRAHGYTVDLWQAGQMRTLKPTGTREQA